MSKKFFALLLMAVMMLFAVNAIAEEGAATTEIKGVPVCDGKPVTTMVEGEEITVPHVPTTGEGDYLTFEAATCTTNGTAYRYCWGCRKYLEEVKVINEPQTLFSPGHNWQDGICGVCGEKHTDAAHKAQWTYVEKVAPTCTKEGSIATWKCVCGVYYHNDEDRIKEPLGHDIDRETGKCSRGDFQCANHTYTYVITTRGNCWTKEEKTYTCAGCDDEYTVTAQDYTHIWSTTDPGYCERCGAVCKHAAWENVTTDGVVTARKCKTCNTQHAVADCDYKVTTEIPGDCYNKGTYVKTCRICGRSERYSEYGHVFVKTHIPATCTQNGKMADVCKCGARKNVTELTTEPALGHPKYMEQIDRNYPYVEPTCTEEGYGFIVCSCGYKKGVGTIPALDHNLDTSVEVTVPASCEYDESIGYTCKRCGEITIIRAVEGGLPATGKHNYVKVTKAATCITDGYKKEACSVCGKVNGSIETLPKNNADDAYTYHKYVTIDVKQVASCTREGVEVQKCALCFKQIDRVIGKKHNLKPYTGYKPETCGTDAEGWLICADCGEEVEATAKATGKHDYVENSIKQGSCQEIPQLGTFCSVCGDQKEGTTAVAVPEALPNAHKWVYDYDKKDVFGNLYYKESTCAQKGQAWATYCSVCHAFANGTDNTGAVVKLSLKQCDYGENQYIAATCTLPERWGKVCKNCGGVKAGATNVTGSEALGHKYEEYTKKSDCVTAGCYYESYCKRCNTMEPGSWSLPLPLSTEHNWKTVTVNKAPTCTTYGYKTEKCSVPNCNARNRVVPIKPEHTWGADDVLKPATCGVAGKAQHTCTICNKTETYDLKPTGKHTYQENYLLAATCDAPAMYGKICTTCGESSSATAVAGSTALGHAPVVNTTLVDANGKLMYVAPTCTKAGLGYKTCSRCGAKTGTGLGLQILAATGHKWSEDKMNEAGTVKYRTCKTCGENQVLQAYGPYDKNDVCATFEHKPVAVAAVAATCTTTGLTEGKKCSVCDKVLDAQKVVAALGHKEEEIPAVEATCTATGLTAGKKCTVCAEITVAQVEVAKKPHAFNDAEKCPDCGAANPDYTNHVHEYTVKWSLHPTDKTKKVATYTCVNKVGEKPCTHTYTEEYGLFDKVTK